MIVIAVGERDGGDPPAKRSCTTAVDSCQSGLSPTSVPALSVSYSSATSTARAAVATADVCAPSNLREPPAAGNRNFSDGHSDAAVVATIAFWRV